MDDAAKASLLESLGLTWNLLSESKGNSALSKFGEIVTKLKEGSTPKEAKLVVSNGIISLLSVATPESIQTALIANLTNIFEYVAATIQSENDKELQMACNYVLSFIQCQVKNATSTASFTTKMATEVVKLLNSITQMVPTLKEKGANDPDDPAHARTESIKLLVKCIQPMDDDAVTAALPVLMAMLMTVGTEKKTPTLRAALIELVTAVAGRKAALLHAHAGDLLECMKAGDFPLGVGQLAEAFAAYASSNANAVKLAPLVPMIMKEPVFTGGQQSQTTTINLMSLLLRIAVVKPDAVSKHVSVLVQIAMTDLLTYLLPAVKLLAATALAGVDDSYYSLETLGKLLRSSAGREFAMEEQRAILGAFDVAKNKCPIGNVFADDTLEALQGMAGANTSAYANIIKWNSGKWAIETDMIEFLSSTGDEISGDNEASEGDSCLKRITAAVFGALSTPTKLQNNEDYDLEKGRHGTQGTNGAGFGSGSGPESKEGLVPTGSPFQNAVAPAELPPAASRVVGLEVARVGPTLTGGYATPTQADRAPAPAAVPMTPAPLPPTPARLVIEEEQLSALRLRVASLEAQL